MNFNKFTFKKEAYWMTIIHFSIPLIGLLLLLIALIWNYLNG